MMPIANVPYFSNSVTGFPAMTVPSALPMGHVMPPVAAAAPSIGSPLTVNAGSPLPLEGVGSCGTLVWITPTAGAIKANDMGLVWFEIKDFGDQAVTDLTAVLRIGFVLKFTAVSYKNEKLPQIRHCATFVAPMFASDFKLASSYSGSSDMVEYLVKSLDCSDEIFHREDPTRKSERYDLEFEARALPFVIRYFVENKTYKLELAVLHMHISNTEQKDMYDYIGKSSQKRTMYFEKRSHLFSIRNAWVFLVPPCIHNTILLLSNMMMERGGATLLQELFDYYLACPDVPLAAREMIGEGKNRFVQLLEAHPWAFSVFPSRVFVSVRRRLIDFGYEKQVQSLDQDPDYEMIMQQRASPLLASRSQQGTPTPMPLHGAQAQASTRSSPPQQHLQQQQQSNANGHHFVSQHQPPPPHSGAFPPVSAGLYNTTYAMQAMHQPPPPHPPAGMYVPPPPPPQTGQLLASAPGGTFRPIDPMEQLYATGTFSSGSMNHAHHHAPGATAGYGHHGNAGQQQQQHHVQPYMGMLGRLPNGNVSATPSTSSARDSPMMRRPETCESCCQTDHIIGTAEIHVVGRRVLVTQGTQTESNKVTADADSQTNDSMYDPWKRSSVPTPSTDCYFSSSGLIGFNGFNTLTGFSDQRSVTQAHQNNPNSGAGTMLVGDLLAEKLGKFTFGGL